MIISTSHLLHFDRNLDLCELLHIDKPESRKAELSVKRRAASKNFSLFGNDHGVVLA